MIQRLLAFLSVLLCGVIILIGGNYWKGKIENTVRGAQESYDQLESEGKDQSSEDKGEEEVQKEENRTLSLEKLRELVRNLPGDVADIFKQAYVNEEKVKIVIAGSDSMGADGNGWSKQAENALEKAFGPELLDVLLFEFDGTSTAFINSGLPDEIIQEAPDILLLEGFTLEDNSGLVPVNISHDNLQTFLGELFEANPSVRIILQPPHPIYAAVNYPVQVAELKKFTEGEGLHYLDHWTYWPDPNSEEILEYLDEEGMPNEKGHELWAGVVINYFAADVEE